MEEPLRRKAEIYSECQRLIAEKLGRLNDAYAETKEALSSESKSTAGDKHETGRAMIQLEQEKMGRQLEETKKLETMLRRVPHEKRFDKVQSGALVKTTEGTYFIAIGLGSVKVSGLQVYVIAPASPLAQGMLGKNAGESFDFRNSTQKILEIY